MITGTLVAALVLLLTEPRGWTDLIYGGLAAVCVVALAVLA